MNKLLWFLIVWISCVLLAGCGDVNNPDQESVWLANPASVYCHENGGTLSIENGEGWQYGLCIFEDWSYCEEWAYFRDECQPGDSAYDTSSKTATNYSEEDLADEEIEEEVEENETL